MSDIHKIADILPDEATTWAQKLHRKKDDIEIHRKALNGLVEEFADDERTITARVSTNDRDRDGEIVEPKGIDLKAYRDNAVLLWAHDYKTPPVGRALWSKTDETGLVCKFQFAQTQFAEDIYQLYKGGFMRAFSIGFIPVDFDTREKVHKKISLLEVSCVPVPANERALVMEAYAKGLVHSETMKKDYDLDAPAAPAEPVAEAAPAEPEVDTIEYIAPAPEAKEEVEVAKLHAIGSLDESLAILLKMNERLDAIQAQLVDLAAEVTKEAPEPEPDPVEEKAAPAPIVADNTSAEPVHIVEIDEPSPEEKAAHEAAKVFKDYIVSGSFREVVQRTIRDEVTLAIDKARGKVY